MKVAIAVILVLLGLGAVGFGGYKYLESKKPSAGLKIDTNPPSLVFIDNAQVGQTPVEKILQPGEVNVRLIPSSTSSALTTYQTKVRLTPQTFTVIRRDFGATDADSAGEVVNLDPQPGSKTASLAVVTSSPDSASVTLDGQPQGLTPILISSITPGDHQITITAPGFTSRTIAAKAVIGYKLNINAKLAGQLPPPEPLPTLEPTPSTTPSATPKPTPISTLPKPYVEIKDTPTGFLRVREKPSTSSKEVGRVNPGDRYPLLTTNSGWYQIKVDLEATSSGWISSQYATKFD